MNHDQMTTRSERPTFYIGTVPIYGDLILAPMSGYSDLPYRMICREMGSAMSYVPLILDDAVLNNAARTRSLMAFGESERPVAIQMLGKEDERLLAACREVLRLEPDMIDLNLGCPARKVAGRGRGAALLDTPEKAAHLARRLVDELPVPVTVKIRLGPGDTNRNYLTVARLLEDAGVAAIAVHGRTREQGFNGRADWAAIAEIKAAVNIPVLANGDVRQVADIDAVKAATGCEGVLIGRGAIGNPWIFERRDLDDVPVDERVAMIRRHLQAMVAFHGEVRGLPAFRKHVVRYVAALDGATDLRRRLVQAQTFDALLEELTFRAIA